MRTAALLRAQVWTAMPLEGSGVQCFLPRAVSAAMCASQVHQALLRALCSVYGTLFVDMCPCVMPSSMRIGKSEYPIYSTILTAYSMH